MDKLKGSLTAFSAMPFAASWLMMQYDETRI